MNLILFEQEEISKNKPYIRLTSSDPRSIHIKKILKAGVGTILDAGIVNGKQGKAVIEAISADEISMLFTPETEPVGLYPLTLILGLSRPPTVKKVLKEATALGVGRFILCGTDNGERSYRESGALKPEKIRDVLIEGVQQAVCTILPEAGIEHSLRCALESVTPAKPGTVLIALDNYEATISITDYWRVHQLKPRTTNQPSPKAILAVGSERGWTDKERGRLRDAGFTLCSIGKRVLRTETASIAGTAVCLSGMGLI